MPAPTPPPPPQAVPYWVDDESVRASMLMSGGWPLGGGGGGSVQQAGRAGGSPSATGPGCGAPHLAARGVARACPSSFAPKARTPSPPPPPHTHTAPDQPVEVDPSARDAPGASGARSKPRKRWGAGGQPEDAELAHPLLGGESALSLMRPRGWRRGGGGGGGDGGRQGPTFFDWWFAKPPMQAAPLRPGQAVANKAEAKT